MISGAPDARSTHYLRHLIRCWGRLKDEFANKKPAKKTKGALTDNGPKFEHRKKMLRRLIFRGSSAEAPPKLRGSQTPGRRRWTHPRFCIILYIIILSSKNTGRRKLAEALRKKFAGANLHHHSKTLVGGSSRKLRGRSSLNIYETWGFRVCENVELSAFSEKKIHTACILDT